MLTLGPRIWQETMKFLDALPISQEDLDYGEETVKHGK